MKEYKIRICGAIDGHRYVSEVSDLEKMGKKDLARLSSECIHVNYFCCDCPNYINESLLEHAYANESFDFERFHDNHTELEKLATNLDKLLKKKK
jgi:hypothetical protein